MQPCTRTHQAGHAPGPKAEAGSRLDRQQAATQGTADAMREEGKGEERKKKRGKKKRKKEKKQGRCKPAPEVPSPLEVVLTRPHSAISARAGAMGTRWGM